MVKSELEELKKANLGLQEEVADLHKRLKEAKDRGLNLETNLIIKKDELNTEANRADSLQESFDQSARLLKSIFSLLDQHETTVVVRQRMSAEREKFESRLELLKVGIAGKSNGKDGPKG